MIKSAKTIPNLPPILIFRTGNIKLESATIKVMMAMMTATNKKSSMLPAYPSR